jgi:ADP-heptose:LPS heptosyltransferase
LPIVLIGGKEDAAFGDAIIADSQATIYNACGKYSLNQSASIIQQAQQVIAHDTGMMHIAAALKKPVISIWGNTIPEFGMYPYFGNTHSLKQQRDAGLLQEVTKLSCRPCSKIGHTQCPKQHFNCMHQQDFSQINL